MLRPFNRGGLGQRDRRMLACSISSETGIAPQSFSGSGHNDRSAALSSDCRENALESEENTASVDRQDAVKRCHFNLFERLTGKRYTGIEDPDIQPSVCFLRGGNSPRHRLLVGHVTLVPTRVPADPAGDLAHSLDVAVGKGNARAALGQLAGDGRTNLPRSARDQRDLSVHIHHLCLSGPGQYWPRLHQAPLSSANCNLLELTGAAPSGQLAREASVGQVDRRLDHELRRATIQEGTADCDVGQMPPDARSASYPPSIRYCFGKI